MPLKNKKAKLDHKQQLITGLLPKTQQTDHAPQTDVGENPDPLENSSNDRNTTSAPTDSYKVDSASADSKSREFKPHWLKLFSWLVYCSVEDYMYCSVCTDGKKSNGMAKKSKCTNFQFTTLRRHADLADHKLLLQAPQLREDLKAIQKKSESKKDAAMKVIFRTVHFMCSEDIPFIKFKAFVDFLHDLGHSELEILKQSDINYDSSFTANEILDCLSDVMEDELKVELCKSPVVTALADESTDISNHKRLVIYTQLISDDMKPSTKFLTNVECGDATGKGIANSIIEEFQKRGVPAQKIMSLGSDGASVMTGKINGCAAIMRRESPHMNNVHCVAHKLALCTSQAAEQIQALKQHQQILTDLFYYFKGSAKRETRIHQIQDLLDDPNLTYKEIHSVRWLSYFNALTAVYRTLDSLLTYLAEVGVNDPKANGLNKKIGTDKFISITYLMMDAMAPVTVLSQFFQKENVDVALVKVKLELCAADLQKVKSMESSYIQSLQNELSEDSSTFKDHHHVTKTPGFNLQSLATQFVDSLLDNLKSRFSEEDLLAAFSVLSMRPVSFLTGAELDTYGTKEIQILCDHYGTAKTSTWKEEGVQKEKTSEPLINSKETLQEWNMLKKVVVAEQYPRDSMWQLWSLISRYHKEFPNITTLARLALTPSVHTAGCERGFSVQNRILTTFRNRLNVDRQQKLMRVKLATCSRADFDFELALSKWKKAKERRLYELKKLK